VYAATGADVQTVIVEGRILVEDRQILAFDVAETLARARELGRKVKKTF
jgi:5-methylthioadenosine/S-adenosylhomocysteine deaminase